MTAAEELKAQGHIHGYVPESDEEVEFLGSYDPSKFPIITVTVDVVALHRRPGKDWSVLLIQRAHWPYKGYWALPGGFIDETETARYAAARELREETHWELSPYDLEAGEAASSPYRDPRGRVIALPYLYALSSEEPPAVKAGDDAAKAQWVKLKELRTGGNKALAFDHLETVYSAVVTADARVGIKRNYDTMKRL